MTILIVGIGAVYALGLLAFQRLGGLVAAAEGMKRWGCAASEACLRPPRA